MNWPIFAEIVRALAAGVTAVIATFKFIRELRKPPKPKDDYDNMADNG
jgi:hypothetical protein